MLLAVLCAVLALGCGAAEQPIADVSEAPAQTNEAPAQTNEAALAGEADQPAEGGLTADDAIDAVEAAGLPIGERRDNTPRRTAQTWDASS